MHCYLDGISVKPYVAVVCRCALITQVYVPQSEITELERTRESMAKELVNLTTKNDEMEEKVDRFTTLQQQYKVRQTIIFLLRLIPTFMWGDI